MKPLRRMWVLKRITCALTTALLMSAALPAMAQEHPILRVGMECAYAPFNWTQKDGENGAVAISGSKEYDNGFDVMVAKKVAEQLGMDLEIYKIKWDGLIMAVNAGKVDAVIAGMSITEKRKMSVDFSNVYYRAGIVALTTRSGPFAKAAKLEDLAGVSATAQLNTIWYEMIDQIPGVRKQPALDTLATMLVALSSGKVDVVICDIPTAMAAELSNSKIMMLELSDGGFATATEDTDCGIAVRKGNTALLKGINEALSGISPKEREELMRRSIEIQPLAQGM